ncbi:unnamed protein product [Eruca vesicaria subsp. sativa]|uniref:Uncharacterized protein n=1 Tax=Eruca vesicaria subsp. sativa TaxID=29727 RepID=A0ABC8IXX1_ERUVS|nr:unnamed protein product [Eruca vesicaria subsp. sativa]
MEEERDESRKSRKEREMERRRLRDRERRQSMSQDERERHLARRRKNYQLRRQRAEVSRIGSQIQDITAGARGNQLAVTSPLHSGDSSTVPLVDSDQSVGIPVEELVKLVGTIRLSRVKHLARTLRKWSTTTGAEASSSNSVATNAMTRRAMSSGLRLSRVKRLVRSKGQQEGLLSQHSPAQGSFK